MGALAIITVEEKDHQPWSKSSLLIQVDKVLDFKKNGLSPLTKTDFYYLASEDKQNASTFFVATHFINTFKSRIREQATERWVWIHVTGVQSGAGREKTVDELWQLNTDRIIWGYDIDTTSCFIWIERGAHKSLRLRTSHVVADISAAASQSRSLSAS